MDLSTNRGYTKTTRGTPMYGRCEHLIGEAGIGVYALADIHFQASKHDGDQADSVSTFSPPTSLLLRNRKTYPPVLVPPIMWKYSHGFRRRSPLRSRLKLIVSMIRSRM